MIGSRTFHIGRKSRDFIPYQDILHGLIGIITDIDEIYDLLSLFYDRSTCRIRCLSCRKTGCYLGKRYLQVDLGISIVCLCFGDVRHSIRSGIRQKQHLIGNGQGIFHSKVFSCLDHKRIFFCLDRNRSKFRSIKIGFDRIGLDLCLFLVFFLPSILDDDMDRRAVFPGLGHGKRILSRLPFLVNVFVGLFLDLDHR